jgi:surface carbohydrate biosynthesis protein (TIGR04326 family)
MIKKDTDLFKIIEKKDKKILKLYEEITEKFFKIKIFKRYFYSYFKKGKKNILFQTNIAEKNLYKNKDEITDFLKLLSIKYVNNKKLEKKLKINLIKKYKDKSLLFKILINIVRSHNLFIRYFIYSINCKLRNLLNGREVDSSNEVIIFSYLLNPKNLKKFKDPYWGDISSLLKKKITWIHHTYINKDNIGNLNLKKFNQKLNDHNKNQHLYIEELVSVGNFFNIYFSYLYLSIKNLFLFLIMKFSLKNNNLTKSFYLIHEEVILESLIGSTFIRALIFDQHFEYIFKKFKSAKNFLYLKEGLSWEKSFLDNFKQYANREKKIYGYVHVPVRYWDLKLNKINKNIHSYPSEYLLVSSKSCKRKLVSKSHNKDQIFLVESLRFNKGNKIKSKKNIKDYKNKFLLLGSINQENTKNMINEILKYIKFYKLNFTIDFKSHPATNLELNSDLVQKIKIDTFKILSQRKYSMIFVDSDSSISLELLSDNFKFLIYKDASNLNTSFLRNDRSIGFFSKYSEINSLMVKNLNKKKKNLFLFNSSNYSRWRQLLK